MPLRVLEAQCVRASMPNRHPKAATVPRPLYFEYCTHLRGSETLELYRERAGTRSWRRRAVDGALSVQRFEGSSPPRTTAYGYSMRVQTLELWHLSNMLCLRLLMTPSQSGIGKLR
jgi:hypothetical protein